jgi:hypothetical protein
MRAIRRQREVKDHWARVRDLGCIVLGSGFEATLHHCHGGSMRDKGIHRGVGQKTSDWLVIPLHWTMHTGALGIDGGVLSVAEWERMFGAQAKHLDEVARRTGVDVWRRALGQ